MGCAQQVLSSVSSVGGGFTYTTWNPSDKGTNVTLSNGDKTAIISNSGGGAVRSAISKGTGKWYWEITSTAAASGAGIGVGNSSALLTTTPGNSDSNGIGYFSNGSLIKNGAVITTWAALSAGDILGIAIDMDNRTLSIYNNSGTLLGTISSANMPTGNLYAMVGASTDCSYVANFGASAFAHTVPSGYNPGLYT